MIMKTKESESKESTTNEIEKEIEELATEMLKKEIEKLKSLLPPIFEKLRSGNDRESEMAAACLTSLFGLDDWIDREICRALIARVGSGRGFPELVLWWFFSMLVKRASGKPWDEAICKNDRLRSYKIIEFIDSVEQARAKGLKTSRNGEPGEAFEEAAKELGIQPSTARDRYYKLKRKGYVDAHKLTAKLAYEILGLSQKGS